MTTDQTEAIRLIQSGLDRLGHTPGAIDGRWGVRTARALRQLIAANSRAASVAPQGLAVERRGENCAGPQ